MKLSCPRHTRLIFGGELFGVTWPTTPRQLNYVFSQSERTVRRYIDKFYQTGDAEPKEGGHGPMKLHGDCEQLILLQMIMEGLVFTYLAQLILFNSKKKVH